MCGFTETHSFGRWVTSADRAPGHYLLIRRKESSMKYSGRINYMRLHDDHVADRRNCIAYMRRFDWDVIACVRTTPIFGDAVE